MNNECPKCKKDADGLTFVEGGQSYTFCKSCSDYIEDLDRTGNVIHDFLHHTPENWVLKYIREAKERRESGKGLWSV